MDLNWIRERVITRIHLVEPESWWFDFTDRASLRVDSFWRILADGRVVAASSDHGHQFGLPAPTDQAGIGGGYVCNRTIRNTFVRENSGDLVLEFDGRVALEVLVTSTGYESWALFCPNGDQLIAIGGGKLHVEPHAR